MRTKKTPHPYVYRAIDRENHVDGYLAKVVRRDARLHRIFQKSDYGNELQRCLRAAVKTARAFDREHPRLTRQQVAQLPRRKKDKDLPVGVRRVRHKINFKTYKFFEASWSPRPNHQKKKRFSVDHYGESRALKLAMAARAEGLNGL